MAAGVLWGTIGPASNGILERSEIGSVETAWLRFVAALPFVIIIGWRTMGRRLFGMPLRANAVSALLGLLVFGSQLVYLDALREIGVTAATLIMLCSIPIMVATASALFLGERQGPEVWGSLALAIGGTALLVIGKPEGGDGDGSLVLGVVLSLITAALASLYALIGRSVASKTDPLQVLSVAYLCGVLAFSPVTLTSGFTRDLSLDAWLLIIYLGVVTQGAAYLLYHRGLETETATTASIVTLLEPLVAAILAWIFFDERLSAISWLGAAVLIASLVLLTLSSARQPARAGDVSDAPFMGDGRDSAPQPSSAP